MAHALVYEAPRTTAIHEVPLAEPGTCHVHVRTMFSGLSRGTERLVFEGRVPRREWARMRAPFQTGDFPFPVRYGYAAVGMVEQGPGDLLGRHVFCLYPHQTAFSVPAGAVVPLPEGLAPADAILAANMETALNALWDGDIRPGQRVLIVGAGLLGWLLAHLLSRRAGLDVVITDIRPETGVRADDFYVNFCLPQDVPAERFDRVFHTSATSAGLQTALDALVFEGRLVELSWYGDSPVTVDLGGNFHANRLQIISSQVGHVSPARRGALGYRDRLALALKELTCPRLAALITEEVGFTDLPAALPRLLAPGAEGIATRIRYD